MYQKIPKVPDFPEIERRMLRFWAERRIFARLRGQVASSDKRWSFLDGPITANNPRARCMAPPLRDFLEWLALPAERITDIRKKSAEVW